MDRLANVASDPDGSSEDLPLQRPSGWYQSPTCTPPPDASEDIETLCYEELIKNGGRPVVPIEVLLQASTEPKRRCEKVLPWLDDPESENRDGGMPMVFSRQLERWWEFRKWQSDNRSTAGIDDGFSIFLEAQKRRYTLTGSHALTSDPTFEQTLKRQWAMKLKLREVPGNIGFPAYREAVKRRLASHNFTRSFQLEDDPRQQTNWATWVEYLNFEYWQSDRHAASLKASESRYHNAWDSLQRLDTQQPYALGRVVLSCSTDSSPESQSFKQQLVTPQAELEALRKKIGEFIRETRPYRQAEEAARRQNILTQWVLEQVHLIETEATQKRTTVTKDQGTVVPSKKRGRADDKGIPVEPQSKRARRGDGSGGRAQSSARKRPEGSGRATTSTDLATTTTHERVEGEPRRSRRLAAQGPNQIMRATAQQATSHVRRKSKGLQIAIEGIT